MSNSIWDSVKKVLGLGVEPMPSKADKIPDKIPKKIEPIPSTIKLIDLKSISEKSIILLQNNDDLTQAVRLARLLKGIQMHYEVIYLNGKAEAFKKKSGISLLQVQNLNDVVSSSKVILVVNLKNTDYHTIKNHFNYTLISCGNTLSSYRIIDIGENISEDVKIVAIKSSNSIFEPARPSSKVGKKSTFRAPLNETQLLEKIKEGRLDFNDLSYLLQIMPTLQQIPMAKQFGLSFDNMKEVLKESELIINAMTDKERTNVQLLSDKSRVARISRGTKISVEKIETVVQRLELLRQKCHESLKDINKYMANPAALMSMLSNLKKK